MYYMHFDYAHKKAEAVSELFGEVVHIVSDEFPVDVDMYLHVYAEDAETSKTVLFRVTDKLFIQKESKLLLPLF